MTVARAALAAAIAPLLVACGAQHTARPAAPVRIVTLLPDLVERPPSALIGGGLPIGGRIHYSVGFDTEVVNRGPGDLLVQGRRLPGQPVMVADQLVERRGAPPLVVKSVGWMRYQPTGHHHWHLLPFANYELRSGDGRRTLLRGRKEGFCLASNGSMFEAPAHQPPRGCGMHRPNALRVDENLPAHTADTYPAYIEGQSILLDGIRPGRYYVVVRLNRERRLRESDYGNDVGSTLVRIAYRKGYADVKVLVSCPYAPPCRQAPENPSGGSS